MPRVGHFYDIDALYHDYSKVLEFYYDDCVAVYDMKSEKWISNSFTSVGNSIIEEWMQQNIPKLKECIAHGSYKMLPLVEEIVVG